MRTKQFSEATIETQQFTVELADGQILRVHAGDSGQPVILASDLPKNLPAFSEQNPPSCQQCVSQWADGADPSHPLQNVGE